MYKLHKQDLRSIIYGAAFMGSGGGGLGMANKIWDTLDNDLEVEVVQQEDAEDLSQLSAVIAFMGEPTAGKTPDYTAILRAWDAQNADGARGEINLAMPVELGPINSLAPILVAMERDNVKVLDADGAGRAVPTLTCLSFQSLLKLSRVMLCNSTNITTKADASTSAIGERLLRPVITSQFFGGLGGLCCYVMNWEERGDYAFYGTLEQTKQLGEFILTDGTTAQDVVDYLNDPQRGARQGTEIAVSGILGKVQSVAVGGFDIGSYTVKADDSDSVVTVVTQNENMLMWSSESYSPLQCGPDLICFWDNETNLPFTNVEAADHVGRSVTLVNVPRFWQVDQHQDVLASFESVVEDLGYAGSSL